MTGLRTLKDILRCNWRRDLVKEGAIKQVREGLRNNKNFFNVFMDFHNLTAKDLK